MTEPFWRIGAASVAGFSHIADGTPCQDAHAVDVVRDRWLVAAVSDGAGSAPKSAEGAAAASAAVVSGLAAWIDACDDSLVLGEDDARRIIESVILALRESLRRRLAGDPIGLRAFHATLVGVVAGPHGGLFFHIGDGAGLATRRDLADAVVSQPQNGEFANETFFVTEDGWADRLRLLSFGPQLDTVSLMSDGVTCFALAKGGKGPFEPVFRPVCDFVRTAERGAADAAIAELLGREALRRITGDDKTLVVAIRAPGDA